MSNRSIQAIARPVAAIDRSVASQGNDRRRSGGSIIVAVLFVIVPLLVPALLQVFGLFVGVLQAYIFTVLTIVYIGGAVRAGAEL